MACFADINVSQGSVVYVYVNLCPGNVQSVRDSILRMRVVVWGLMSAHYNTSNLAILETMQDHAHIVIMKHVQNVELCYFDDIKWPSKIISAAGNPGQSHAHARCLRQICPPITYSRKFRVNG